MTEALISQEKFEELTKELDELRTVRRREVAEQLEYARSLGDLSENAEYQEAREMQAAVEERIGKLEGILKNAKIVRGSKSDIVGMGALNEDIIFTIKEGKEEELLKKIKYTGTRGNGIYSKPLWTPQMMDMLERIYREKFNLVSTSQVFFCRGIT